MSDSENVVMNNRAFTVEIIKAVLSIPGVIILLIICFWGSVQQVEQYVPQLLSNMKIVKFKDFAIELSESNKILPSKEIREVLVKLSKKDLLALSNFKFHRHTPDKQFAERNFGKLIELGLIEHVDKNMPKDKYVLAASKRGKEIQDFLDGLILSVLDEL